MSNLNKNDYINILKYYNKNFSSKSYNEIKNMAEKILAEKLCKCIKKVNKNNNESRAIALCKTSVLHKKGIKSFNFTCKKRKRFLPKKGTSVKLIKRNNK
jgi:hypothetical protein